MRVLQVLPSIASESGGPARSTLANCRAVQAVDPGIRFTLATTGQGLTAGWRGDFEAQMPRHMKLAVFPAWGRHAFTFSPRLAAWLWRHVAEFELVVVRALLHPITSTAAWISRRHGVPYVLAPHGTLSLYTFWHRRTLLKRAYLHLVDSQTLAGARAVRFTSEAERREAPVPSAGPSIWVIPHPFEPTFGARQTEKRSLHQILFLSRLHPVKGIDVLLEAFRQVQVEVPGACLVLAGSGTAGYERHVRSKIERLDLKDSVKLPGFVEGKEKVRLLQKSAVFVLPSHQESFGVAVVEAMDASLPVVITRGVSIWPEVEEAEAGIVVKERTPAAVGEALVRLIKDGPLRRRQGRNGRDLVRRAFAPEAVGRRLRDLYRAV